MPRKSYTPFPNIPVAKSQLPVGSLKGSSRVNFEAPDPADVYAQKYRQSLPPHPAQIKPCRPPPPPPSRSMQPPSRETSKAQPARTPEMRPLMEIGRHIPPSSKRLARNASKASTHSRQSLPKIDEVPDLDSDTISINSSHHSRSSSNSSNYSSFGAANRPHITREVAEEYMRMDRREAAIRASMERTSWMIDEESGKGKGSRDLVEHINYVISAWQREK